MKWIMFTYWFIAVSTNINAQLIFHQDTYHGGVTGAGFSAGLGFGTGSFNVFIEPGSTIRKAYLFTYKIGHPPVDTIALNGYNYVFNTSEIVSVFSHLNTYASPITIYAKDITTDITPTNLTYNVSLPSKLGLPINWGYNTVYLHVEYENILLPKITSNIIINTIDNLGFETYNITNLNPINTSFPIGFAINTDRFSYYLAPFYYELNLNSNNIGNIGFQPDNINSIWNAAGVKGHYYYQNNNLFGLDDDTPDAVVHHSDGLADISSYILNNSNNFSFDLIHNQFPNNTTINTGIEIAFFLAYTSPCDTFSVTHTPDTTICHGIPLQLQINGGQAWEWTPQVGLSCYDCPNPVFTSDSSILYSVRVWNNDSCSKVFPLRIRVKEPLPDFNFTITPSECGDSTGSITITPVLSGFSYINQTTQDTNTTGIFSGLESGFYPISIVNNSACSFDTVVFVPETLSVHAGFIASPNAGISPLPVAFTNTSSHANSYQWIYENQSSTQENISHIFQQDGIYPVMLIAYGYSILCADTAYDTIYVYLPIEVEIPNIFTPNSDQNNDQWGIKINVPAEADVQIFNRWGEIIVNRKEEVLSPGFIPLWDGGEHVGGVYYYVIRVRTDFEKKEFKGNITLVR